MTEKTDNRDSDEELVEIEMELLRTFTNHPFKVISDSQMIELQDSIKKYGVLNPLIVRPRKEGYYEIISGHRRNYSIGEIGGYLEGSIKTVRQMENERLFSNPTGHGFAAEQQIQPDTKCVRDN